MDKIILQRDPKSNIWTGTSPDKPGLAVQEDAPGRCLLSLLEAAEEYDDAMIFRVVNHRLLKGDAPVQYNPTPNLSAGTISPRLIVIHYTGTNSDESALNWLTQKGSGVSAHLLISKAGQVWQLAPFNRRAWHAGRSYYSHYSGKDFTTTDVNSHSIGIELTGTGDHFPNAQINALVDIVTALKMAYPIIDIVGHDFVAVPAGRKVDPGKNFPWEEVF